LKVSTTRSGKRKRALVIAATGKELKDIGERGKGEEK
jgi:hypothetical protein